MKFYLNLLAILAISHLAMARQYNTTCFYDTSSINRRGSANFTIADLKLSLQYCTHVVYGHVGINPNNFELIMLDQKHQHRQFNEVKNLKSRYRQVKFLLSVGGDKDLKQSDKYMKLLEAGGAKYQKFIKSTVQFMKKYSFDGLDLAYQFPKNSPFTHHSAVGGIVAKAKKALGVSHIVDKNAKQHKQQFTNLIHDLNDAFKRDRFMLTLTVLPNVNTTWYFDIPNIIRNLDFVNLAAYDFSTPERNPEKADFLAPIFPPPRNAIRTPQSNIDYIVHQWLTQTAPGQKINLGITTRGRTWKVNKQLKSIQMPITSYLNGAAAGGNRTQTSGLLSWPEICLNVPKMTNYHDKKYGDYAIRSSDVRGNSGLLITYESPTSVADKVDYIKLRSLGGAAIFDLSLDDFSDQCKTGKFPLLKAIKTKLY